MKKHLHIIFFATLLVGAALLVQNRLTAKAQDGKISYPVAELGNCTSKADCKTYCDNLENISVCADFAKNHGLMSEEEAAKAKKLAGIKGPGGCTNKETCETYCDDTSHIEECISFAEQNGMMSASELSDAKKVMQALKQGAQTPGDCKGKQQCDAYCQEPAHMEACLDFAEKAGMIPPEELAQARKVLPLMQRGEMPGNCRGKEQCEAYCQDENHFEECTAFAEKAGMMSAEDAAMARKTKGKGPGGCKSKEACDAFCNNPNNQETCVNFAKDNGLISEEEIRKMENGKTEMKNGLQQAPPEVKQCLREKLGEDVIGKIESGKFMPGPESGEAMKYCFEHFIPEDKRGTGENRPEQGASPESMDCIKEIYGEEFAQKLKSGEVAPPPDIGQKIGECIKRPSQQPPDNRMPPPGGDFGPLPEGQIPQNYPMPPQGQMPPEGQRPPPNQQQPPQEQMQPLPMQPPQEQQSLQPPPPPPPPANSGQVQGAYTSRLPGFIRWLLGY